MREPIAMDLCRNVVLLVVMIMATEQARSDYTFGEPMNMGPTVNSSVHDFCPRISTDGLSLFFPSDRSGGAGGRDMYVTTRPTKDDPWGSFWSGTIDDIQLYSRAVEP